MARSPHRIPLIAGNWKMNGLTASLAEIEALAAAGPWRDREVLVCPRATLLATAVRAGDGRVSIGGQDCHPKASGAHTGDLSAGMLADAGAKAVIVGHSERRTDHGERDALVHGKAAAAQGAGLTAVICVGETEAERLAGQADDVVRRQMAGSIPADSRPDNTVIAYEPVWAIGTGRTPTSADIEAMHMLIRKELAARFGNEAAGGFRILYGGSVKPDNAAGIFALTDVDGGLVGGASLKAHDFLAIVRAFPG